MPTKNELDNEHSISLDLYQCMKCGLVQFDCEPVPYYKDVIRSCGVSRMMRKLKMEQYEHFIGSLHLKGKKIWEVGCGGGEFLEILTKYPVQAFGVEHNRELIDLAHSKGLIVEEGFVGGPDYCATNGPFDAFVSFNFLEHQPHPNEMLQGIYNNLTDDGVGMITVPSFEHFLKNAPYYEFIRDHIGYYTKETLSYLFIQNGFSIIEETTFNNDICMIVKKRESVNPRIFLDGKEEIKNAILKAIHELDTKDEISVWGASHQAFTLLSTMDLGGRISCIIDSAPFKVGLFSPASHINIVSPDILKNSRIECVIIMAPAYSDEIFKQILAIKPNIRRIMSVLGRSVVNLK